MSLAQNLTTAANAIARARARIRGSSNRRSDRIASAGGIEAIIAARTGFDETLLDDVDNSRATVHITGNAGTDTTNIANAAIASGVGNCHELAAVAFEYLRASGTSPVDLMTFTAAGYDHVSVVIGVSTKAPSITFARGARTRSGVIPGKAMPASRSGFRNSSAAASGT